MLEFLRIFEFSSPLSRRKFDAKTIEWHRSQLMKKLGVQSAAELANYAINERLTCTYAQLQYVMFLVVCQELAGLNKEN